MAEQLTEVGDPQDQCQRPFDEEAEGTDPSLQRFVVGTTANV